MLLNTEGLLSDIAAGLQNGRYRMDQRGEPTEFTRVAIVQVVDKVLGGPASRPDTGSEGDESDAGWMHAVLVAEFSVWAAEYVREGSAAATRNLKRRLVQQLSAL